jgi:hypothetical protein
MNSNFRDWETGRSAGLAPLGITVGRCWELASAASLPIVPDEKHGGCFSAKPRMDTASAFNYSTGLQYLVATVGESGVSATKQKTSALPFCRNTPAPPPGGWVMPATV